MKQIIDYTLLSGAGAISVVALATGAKSHDWFTISTACVLLVIIALALIGRLAR